MKSLLVKNHPRKSLIGKATGHSEKVASKNHIKQYLKKWLVLSVLTGASGIVNAAPGDPAVDAGAAACTVTIIGGSGGGFIFTLPRVQGGADVSDSFSVAGSGGTGGNLIFNTPGEYVFINSSTTPPAQGFLTPTTTVSNEPVQPAGTSITMYITAGANSLNETCSYSYTLTTDAMGDQVRSNFSYYPLTLPTIEPTAVPLFSPIGLIATIGGLLWFGRRRKAAILK